MTEASIDPDTSTTKIKCQSICRLAGVRNRMRFGATAMRPSPAAISRIEIRARAFGQNRACGSAPLRRSSRAQPGQGRPQPIRQLLRQPLGDPPRQFSQQGQLPFGQRPCEARGLVRAN